MQTSGHRNFWLDLEFRVGAKRGEFMKKIIFCFINLFFLSLSAFAEDFKILENFCFNYHGDWPLKIQGTEVYDISPAQEPKLLKNFQAKVNDNGFLEVTEEKKSKKSSMIFLDKKITYIHKGESMDGSPILAKNVIKSIKSDGNLVEKIAGETIDYSVENLRNSILWGSLEEPYWYFNSNKPFVTKRKNSGIGEKITIEFARPQKSISILGGYADVNRQDLFKKNNRLKKIKISDLKSSYSKIYDFEDIALFQDAEFDSELTDIEIEILEVYKGTKYDDTCISGIMVYNLR